MSDNLAQALDILDDVIQRAGAAGADAADAVFFDNASLSVSFRMGKLEDVERAESMVLGLRAFMGARQAVASTTDVSQEALTALVERVAAMARAAPEDPYCGLADHELLASGPLPDLDLCDAAEPDV